MANQINIPGLCFLHFPRQHRILSSEVCCMFFRFILVFVYNHYYRQESETSNLSDFKIKLIQRIFCDSDPCQT